MLTLIVEQVTFCLETLPEFYNGGTDYTSPWYIMEAVAISIFTVEIILRVRAPYA